MLQFAVCAASGLTSGCLPCCRYIEQVAGALSGREHAVETVQALLRSCRAKTVSSVAAMHQVRHLSDAVSLCIIPFSWQCATSVQEFSNRCRQYSRALP